MAMDITLQKFQVGNVAKGFVDDPDEGAFGYGGMLEIRPPYQRAFVYNETQQQEVVRTVLKGYPLGSMYWVQQPSGDYECLDGQQRTLSLLYYLRGDYSVDGFPFHSQPGDIQDAIRKYELFVYMTEGTASEKLDWFRVINTAGESLTPQERRNAVFHGPMVSEARRWFSRTGGPSQVKGGKLLKGTAIRQQHLETAIKWISADKVEKWMADNQHRKEAADDLWMHFEAVIDWVRSVFVVPRTKEMCGVDWGKLYREHSHRELDAGALEREIADLMQREDVTKKRGIYSFVLDRNESHLSLRAFTDAEKREAYERQGGKCAISGEYAPIEDMEADHIEAFSEGGKTIPSNLQMLTKKAHKERHAQGASR